METHGEVRRWRRCPGRGWTGKGRPRFRSRPLDRLSTPVSRCPSAHHLRLTPQFPEGEAEFRALWTPLHRPGPCARLFWEQEKRKFSLFPALPL